MNFAFEQKKHLAVVPAPCWYSRTRSQNRSLIVIYQDYFLADLKPPKKDGMKNETKS